MSATADRLERELRGELARVASAVACCAGCERVELERVRRLERERTRRRIDTLEAVWEAEPTVHVLGRAEARLHLALAGLEAR